MHIGPGTNQMRSQNYGLSVQMVCTVTGFPIPTIKWLKDGGKLVLVSPFQIDRLLVCPDSILFVLLLFFYFSLKTVARPYLSPLLELGLRLWTQCVSD